MVPLTFTSKNTSFKSFDFEKKVYGSVQYTDDVSNDFIL